MITIIKTTSNEFEDITTRTAEIVIGIGNEAYFWWVGGLPESGDILPILEARESELFAAAQNGEAIDFWEYALSYFNTQRAERRTTTGLTESMYYEAQRWQADPDTPFGLDGQRGRMSREQYAGWVIKAWIKIEADYSLAVSLVKQAKTVDEIAIILARRG